MAKNLSCAAWNVFPINSLVAEGTIEGSKSCQIYPKWGLVTPLGFRINLVLSRTFRSPLKNKKYDIAENLRSMTLIVYFFATKINQITFWNIFLEIWNYLLNIKLN